MHSVTHSETRQSTSSLLKSERNSLSQNSIIVTPTQPNTKKRKYTNQTNIESVSKKLSYSPSSTISTNSQLCIIKHKYSLCRCWFENAIKLKKNSKSLLIIKSTSSLFSSFINLCDGDVNIIPGYNHIVKVKNTNSKSKSSVKYHYFLQIPVLISSHGGIIFENDSYSHLKRKLSISQGEGIQLYYDCTLPKSFIKHNRLGHLIKWQHFNDKEIMLYINQNNIIHSTPWKYLLTGIQSPTNYSRCKECVIHQRLQYILNELGPFDNVKIQSLSSAYFNLLSIIDQSILNKNRLENKKLLLQIKQLQSTLTTQSEHVNQPKQTDLIHNILAMSIQQELYNNDKAFLTLQNINKIYENVILNTTNSWQSFNTTLLTVQDRDNIFNEISSNFPLITSAIQSLITSSSGSININNNNTIIYQFLLLARYRNNLFSHCYYLCQCLCYYL